MPNQTNDKIAHAQKLKDQFKYKEALEILSTLENVDELTIDEQIRFYLLQSSLFNILGYFKKALNSADRVVQISIKTGNLLGMLDASLLRGLALAQLGNIEECNNSILKCEELIKELIKDQPEKVIGKRKANLTLIKVYYNGHFGKWDKSLEYSKTYLALSKKYGTKQDLASVFNLFGVIYKYTGDFTKALENHQNCLKISIEINNKIGMAWSYYCIGYIYRLQGDLDLSLEYYEPSLSLGEQMEHKILLNQNFSDIGLTYYEKGELDKALNYLTQGLQLKREIGNTWRISIALFEIFLIYLDQNELESAQTCLEELKTISDTEENIPKKHRFLIANALLLKKSGQTRKIFKAEEILNEILGEKSVENSLLVISLLNLCELIYKEFQITNETEILEEIPHLITNLLEIAEKMHSFLLLAEIYIFKAKIELLNFELDEAQQLLTKAQQIARKYHLSRLEKKISMEHDQLLEKLDIWKELKERNAPLSDRLKVVSFEGDLNLMMRKKEIEQVEVIPEEPLLLSIISNGGVSLFTHFFSKEWDDKLMFGSFMTAFNMFSHEFFSMALDRVKIGDNTIIMVPFEDKFLCYVIKGQTYPAQQKLNKFSEGIQNSEDILDAINSAFSTGAVLNNENAPGLVELCNTIFA